MNPRYRRVLIPGLLTVLVVVVVLTSLARAAKGAESDGPAKGTTVSTITDPRVAESSGLALSIAHTGIAYTINDSGNAPIVYAVQVNSGKVVGATTVRGGVLRDTEALSIDPQGKLWISDTGDNLTKRHDQALYSLPEPGPGDHSVVAARYPVTYPGDASHNVEALLINPHNGNKYLVGKQGTKAPLFRVTVEAASATAVRVKGAVMPATATDGAFTPDGRFAVVRTYFSMTVYDAKTWQLVRSTVLPLQQQGETLVVEPTGTSVLIGSEGKNSQLVRVALDTSAMGAAQRTAAVKNGGVAQTPADNQIWWYVGGAIVVAIAVGAALAFRRR